MSRIATYSLALALLLGIQLSAQTPAPTTPQPTPQDPPSASQQTPMAQSPSTANEPSAQDEARDRLERLGSALNLTDAQKTKLQPILANEIQQVRDLRANAGMSPEQKQASFQQTLAADHAKVQAILTPEQQQKLADLRQKAQSSPSSQTPSQTPQK